MKVKKNILLCPLDWGLGHASRCVPIIRELIALEQNVIVAASKRPLAFLQNEFPAIKFIDFPGYNIKYPQNSNMNLSMFLQIPKILQKINQEHKSLKKIVTKYDIDVVISDNRYGFWHPGISSVFMTHQLKIKCGSKFIENILMKINQKFIKNFDECWIPDFETNNNLSGSLSHLKKFKTKIRFIGPQSRFSVYPPQENNKGKYHVLVIISGPEPQRTIFEKKILDQLKNLKIKTLILAGKPELQEKIKLNDYVYIQSHLHSKDFLSVLKHVEFVVSRSGYSTIMDLAFLKKKAIFIPTPGQTEQEYLAKYHTEKGHCLMANQRDFELKTLIEKIKEIKGFDLELERELLIEKLETLLSG